MLADDLVEVVRSRQLGAEERDLSLERPPLERPARERQELVLLEGLGQVVESAELHGGHGGPDRLHRRDQDHLDAFVNGLHPLEDLDPVHSGEPDVEQHEVHRRGPDEFERAGTVGDVDDVVVVLEDQSKRLPDTRVVVDDENHRARHAGTLAPIPHAGVAPP